MFPLHDDAPRSSFPFVNWALILANVVVFLYEWRLPVHTLDHVIIPHYALIPARLDLFWQGAPVTAAVLWLPLLTSMFLHGGWLHLLGNMWMLYLFGDNVEDVFGHGKYLLFYLTCGVAAGLTQAAFNLHSAVPTLGASGAIAGVLGAYFVKFPRARVFTLIFLVVFFFFWDLPAWVILGYWFLVQALSGFNAVGLGSAAQGGIAWFAHVGGFLCGILLVFWMTRPPAYARG